MTKNKQKLSACMITYNEEEKIASALESIKWVDEIIIVDSFSTDSTLEICRQYTDKIYQHPWEGFGKQRNFALSLASFSWILVLDADERVSPELKSEIIELKEEEFGEYDSYYIPFKNYFLGKWIKHCGWYPDLRIRLFNKEKGKYKESEVHESVSLLEGSRTGYLKHHIDHYTHNTISECLRKLTWYAKLAASEMAKEGKKSSLFSLSFNPIATFLKMYILKLGFLEYNYGFLLSAMYAYYTFLKYIFLLENGLKLKENDKISY